MNERASKVIVLNFPWLPQFFLLLLSNLCWIIHDLVIIDPCFLLFIRIFSSWCRYILSVLLRSYTRITLHLRVSIDLLLMLQYTYSSCQCLLVWCGWLEMKTTYWRTVKVKCLGKTFFWNFIIWLRSFFHACQATTLTALWCVFMPVDEIDFILAWCCATILWEYTEKSCGWLSFLHPRTLPLSLSFSLVLPFFRFILAKITPGLAKHVKLFQTEVCIFFQR